MNRITHTALLVTATVFVTAGVVTANACERPRSPLTEPRSSSATTGAGTSAKNTEMNRRDRGGATMTPIDQSNKKDDIDVAANIRRAVVKDDTLSVDAHNAKVIVTGGVVTLRGPVKSEAEKSAVEAAARQEAPGYRIDNQLEIAP